MRAVWYARQGAARDVLKVGDRPTPVPAPGEVRVRLAASGVNPADCNRRAGRGYAMEFPLVIPDSDGAGTVDAVGDGADPSWLGRRVWLYNGQRGRAFGTAAEYICISPQVIASLPDNTSFDEGACLGIPCMTAWRCVFLDGEVADRWVLVTGGAGAVGHYAVQLAAWGGARLIATVSSEEKAARARAGGADHVIDYRRENVTERVMQITRGAGVDRIVEVDFGGNIDASVACLAQNGSLAAYASRGNASPKVNFYALMRKNITLHAVLLHSVPLALRQRAQREINTWLETGCASHTIASTFPLAQTAAAHEMVEAGGKQGTVVVQCER